jgi:hypothetical protein
MLFPQSATRWMRSSALKACCGGGLKLKSEQPLPNPSLKDLLEGGGSSEPAMIGDKSAGKAMACIPSQAVHTARQKDIRPVETLNKSLTALTP